MTPLPFFKTKNAQHGLSLVELMIALALSTTLILGIFTVYFDSNKTARLGTSLARIQESARVGMEMFFRDLRMAGFQGCADSGSVPMRINAKNSPTTDFAASALRGWEINSANWADGTEFDGETLESNALQGSDVVAVQRGEVVPVTLSADTSPNSANLDVQGDVGRFEQNDIVLISDCEFADLFRITSDPDSGSWTHTSASNSSNRLGQAYTRSAKIMEFISTAYFVRDTGRIGSDGNPVFALFRHRGQTEELIEGVESLQVLYGERLASGNIRFVPADTVDLNMTNVVAVRIGMLVSDSARVRDSIDTASYELPGATIAPASEAGAVVTHPEDNRIRRAFIATVQVRNRN